MKTQYSLGQKAKRALTGLTFLASSFLPLGCATQRGLYTQPTIERETIALESPQNIKGAEIGRVANTDTTYSLESVVINGNRLYVERNTLKQDGELDFMFVRDEDKTLWLDSNKRVASLSSDEVYIPTIVKKDDSSKKTTIELSTTGEFAKRAQRNNYNPSGIETGIIRETEEDISFFQGTQKIGEEEYFTPRVEAELSSNRNSLPFYLMQTKESTIGIKQDGQIIIRNPNGFYRANKISREDYSKRNTSGTSASKTD